MNRIMIDFETFGNGKNACVVQIGACSFDLKQQLKLNIDARSCGGQMDPDTVYWWLMQSPAAIASITSAPLIEEPIAFHRLNNFLADADEIWSHATFDFVILQESLKRLGIRPSYKYGRARDIRTLNALSRAEGLTERKGVHHDAMDDCIFQIEYCKAALKSLGLEA